MIDFFLFDRATQPTPHGTMYTMSNEDKNRSTDTRSTVRVASELISYNSFQYGDEASLYSIAEDSREGKNSEFTPTKPNNNDVLNQSLGAGQEDLGIEICLEDVDVDDDDNMTKSSDVVFHYMYPRHRCRLIAAVCLLCLLVLAAVLAVIFTQVVDTSQSRSQVSSGISEKDGNGIPGATTVVPQATDPPSSLAENDVSTTTNSPTQSPITDAPIPTPTDTPTTNAPTEDTGYEQAETLVKNALDECQGGKSFSDPSTAVGQVFQSLVQEVYDGRSGGVFDEVHGEDYLRERYALEMLYRSTGGKDWNQNSGWLNGDPCTWSGVECNTRQAGSCAVTELNLSKCFFCAGT